MMDDELITQGLMAVPVVHAIDWLKARGLLGKDASVSRWSFWISVASALVISLGVHIRFEGSLQGGGEFKGTFPPLDIMVSGAQHFLASFASQQGYFGFRQLVALLQAINDKAQPPKPSVPA
jgi:hypothetical protein